MYKYESRHNGSDMKLGITDEVKGKLLVAGLLLVFAVCVGILVTSLESGIDNRNYILGANGPLPYIEGCGYLMYLAVSQ